MNSDNDNLNQTDHTTISINRNSTYDNIPDIDNLERYPSVQSSPTPKDEKAQLRKEKIRFVLLSFGPLLITLVMDVGLPLILYYILKKYISVLAALLISGIPPLLHVVFVFVKKRKFDILGGIFIFSFTLSAILSTITGDVRLALLRDSATTAAISFLFFITLIPLKIKRFQIRPLIFLIARQTSEGLSPIEWTTADGKKSTMGRMDWYWQYIPSYRTLCYGLNAAWAIVLMGEFAAKLIMILASSLDVDRIVLYSNLMFAAVSVTMTCITIVLSIRFGRYALVFSEQWFIDNDYTDRLPN